MKRIIAPSVAVVMLLTAILGCGTSGGSGTVTERIDADDGGSITSDDGMLTLEIPAGALAEDTRITIQEVDAGDMPDEFADLGEGMGYELTPEGLTFTEPVAVSLALDPASLEADSGDSYEVYALLSWSEENGMEPLQNLVMEISHGEGETTLRGELSHFSYLTRTKVGVTVSLEEVDREQPVGGSFTASVIIEGSNIGPDPVSSVVEGSFHAYGSVELVGSGEFSPSGPLGRSSILSYSTNGNFQCQTEPGIGSYGVQVHAVSTFAPDDEVPLIMQGSIVLDSVVECVAELPATPPPETPEDFVEYNLRRMGYTPEQITQLKIARILDPTGDWIWSIFGMTPGERVPGVRGHYVVDGAAQRDRSGRAGILVQQFTVRMRRTGRRAVDSVRPHGR